MSTPNQSEIDALVNGDAEESAEESQSESSVTQSVEHTQNSPENQGVSGEVKRYQKRANWGENYPEFQHKQPPSLNGRLDEYNDTLNQILSFKELLMLAKIDQDLHRSYYKMWVDDANWIFRAIVRLKNNYRDVEEVKEIDTVEEENHIKNLENDEDLEEKESEEESPVGEEKEV